MKKKMSKKTVLIVVGIVLLLSITIGTALISSILTIQGNTTIKENSWIIYFDSVRKSTDSVASDNDARITNFEKTRIEFSANLKDPGDFYEFTVYTVNDGTIDAMVDSVEKFQLTEEQLKYLEFNVTYDNGREIKRCDPLDAHTRKRIKAVVKFKDGVNVADYSGEDVNLDLYFDIHYVQKDNACPPDPVGNEKLLTIRPHGGKYNGRTDETRVYLEPGTNYTLEEPTRFLYNFTGWEVISPESGGTYTLDERTFTMGEEDVIIEAEWEEGAFVARIMNTYYPSIQDAFDHVDDGWDDNTVYLIKNQTEDPINNATSSFVFDLGGHVVSGRITNSKTGNIRLINGRVEAIEEQSEALINYGTLTLGTLGGGVQVENSIAIVGNEVGLRNIKSDGNVGEFYFYDGYIEAVAALVGGYTDKEPEYYIFSEHMTDKNDQRVYLVRNPNRAIAKTTTDGVIYYYNLQDAINQASINKKKGNLSDDDYVISAVRNFEAAYKLKVQEEETIIFDLDGHTITTGDTITNNGNFTIKNTAQTASTIKPSRTITNTSNLTISNVAIRSSTDENTINNSGNLSLTKVSIQAKGGYGIENSGSGTISLDNNTTISSDTNYGIYNTANNLVLDNGTIYGIRNKSKVTLTGNVKPQPTGYVYPIRNDSTLVINDLELTNNYSSIFIYSDGGTNTFNNSKIQNRNQMVDSYSSTIIINNSELVSTATSTVSGGTSSTLLNSGKIESQTSTAVTTNSFTIHDGEVTGVGSAVSVSSFTMTGGTVTSDNVAVSTGSANVSGGTITSTDGNGINGSDVTISGGTINATNGTGINTTSVTITGGTVNGGDYGVQTSSISMTAGTVDSKYGIGALVNSSGTITGGTITGETYGVRAKNQLTLGSNDGTISSTSPVIVGELYGLYIEGNDINFYDGILKGQTDGYYGKITGLPTGGLVVDGTETIDEVLYQTDTVNAFRNWLQVGEEQFNNIDAACEAIEGTGTITVIDDADVSFIQNFTKNNGTDRNITFDLNGHHIVSTQPIYNSTNVTIVDNSNSKDGSFTNTRVDGIINNNDGTLTINSGEYVSTINDKFAIVNNGVMEINAAHINGPTAGMKNTRTLTINDVLIDESPIGIKTTGGSIVMEGGTITASNVGISNEGGSSTVNGGSIYGTNYGIGGGDGGVVVNGGIVRSTNNNALYSYYGSLTVNGGQVISEKDNAMLSHSTMYVTGGYVEGTQGVQNEQYCTWYSCWYNNIEVSGGHIVGTANNGINAKGDSSGQLIITGGTIEGKTNGVNTIAKTRLGSDNGTVSTSTPVLIGHTNYGIVHSNYTEFYDGILKGIEDGRYGLVSIIPDGYTIKDDYEYIDRVEYQTDYLVEKGNWLKVGNKEFNSINKANQYITEENHTMTVIADAYVDFAQTINANYDVTFDFNGHSLIMTQPITVNTNTRFTNTRDVGGVNNLRDNAIVINGSSTSIIDGGVYHSDIKTSIINNGTLTINGGEIKADYDYALSSSGNITVNGGLISGERQAGGISKTASIIVNGGTIQSENQTALSSTAGGVTVNNGSIISGKGTALHATDTTLVINNGTVQSNESTAITSSNSYYGSTYITVNNGNITGNVNGITSSHSSGTITINNGNIIGETGSGLVTSTTSYINGGNLEGYQYGLHAKNSSTVTQIGNNDGTINIDAPIIKGDLYGLYISDSSTVNFYDGIIKGITGRHSGVITSIASHAQIFEDEEVINEETYLTEYLVTETEIVINENTGETYGNLQTAISEAQDGEVLRLLTNVPLYYEIDIVNHPNITLNMDGKSISTNKRWRITVPFTLTNTSEIESTLKISTAVNLINTTSNLTINNISLKNTNSSDYVINNTGKLTLSNSKIEAINGVQSNSELIINNSQINTSKNTISNTGKMTINGGTYTGDNYSLYSNSSRPVDISNATFNGVFYNSGSNTATLDDSIIHGNLQNNTSNLTVTRTNIDTGRVTNNGTMTMIDSTFAVTTSGGYYGYYQDVALSNTDVLTLNHSNVLINREAVGKSSIAIQNTGELNVTNGSKVYIGIDNSSYTYRAIYTSSSGITTIDNSEIKATGGSTNYGVYTDGANAKTTILTGIITSENATTGYGSYIDKGTFEMGHYEGQGVTSEDVSITNPLVYATGKSRGIGVKKVNASFNFYDGIIRASKYAKPETTTNVEYQFEVTTYIENDTGYEYAILEWMRNDYQGDTVCLLNDVYYTTIQDAIDRASSGDEIILLKSIEEDFTVPTNKNFRLNLNQHSITTQVTNNGTMNVYNGSLQNFEKTTIINKGTLILGENDNNVSSSNIRIVSEATTIQSTGTIVMYDGYIEGQEAIDGKINQIAQYSRIRTVKDEQSEKKFIQSLSPEAIQNGETDLIITVDPNTGTYEGSSNVKEIFKKYHETYTLSEPTKRGCIFTGWDISDDAIFDETTNTITVDISDVTATAQWEVSPNAIAKIGDDYYLSLQDALDNATDGQVVELLKDTTEDITNRANVKLDLGGFTVTGAFINQGELRLVHGTVENPSGIGMINQKQLVMGENDGTVHEETVKIIGTTVGLQQDAIFKFYDGFIEGDIALNGRVDAQPSGYFLYNDRNNIKNCQRVYLIGNPANAVATIENGGTQYFFSLQSAIDTAAITGDEIFIARDFEAAYAVGVPENTNILINMRGHNITMGNTITNNGTLKIYDTSEPTGSITTAKAIVNNGTLTVGNIEIKQATTENTINNNGTLNLENATIRNAGGYSVNSNGPLTLDANSKIIGTKAYSLYNNYENLVLTAGQIDGIVNNKSITLDEDILINSNSTTDACIHSTATNSSVIMNGGTCTSRNIGISLQGTGQTFTMNGGQINTASHSVYVNNGNGANTTIINDGELTSTNNYTIYLYGRSHNLTVNDGTITSTNSTAIWTGSYSSSESDRYNVNIKGGTIKGGDYGAVFYYSNLNITGGTFETTSTNRDRYALWKYYGNNATIKNTTLTAEKASGFDCIGSATIEDTTINANASNSYGVVLENGTINLKTGTVINTPGKSSTGLLLYNTNGMTVNYNGAEINSANVGINTTTSSGARTINLNSGTISGDNYGIYLQSSAATVNVGDKTIPVSIEDPLITGGLYGIYKTAGTMNFYNGVLRGYNYGYNNDFYDIRKSKDITEENEVISEAIDYLTYSGTNVSPTATTKYAKSGNGYAKITYLGEDNGTCTTNQEWTFDYLGEEETFNVTCAGDYKLEVWGAQGGTNNSTYIGGYGGYSTGEISLSQGETLYINVGGEGTAGQGRLLGGYNGGGIGFGSYCSGTYRNGASGGGATHIATASGLLASLENNKASVIIVAGGGGGSHYFSSASGSGASGGGYIGATSTWTNNGHSYYVQPTGGTQTSGGTGGYSYSGNSSSNASFGHGGDYDTQTCNEGSGGGAGWYGGGSGQFAPGAGGSGYIGNERLTNKYMYGYQVEPSKTEWIKNYLVDKDKFLQVNDETFNSIDSAVEYIVENLNSTGTIILLKDATIQEDSTFAENTTISFDLNGHILQATRPIVNNGILTIIDSTQDKEGMIYDKDSNVIVNHNNLHIVNGTIQSDNANGIVGNTNDGTLTIDEGVIIKGVNAIDTTTNYTINVTNATITGTNRGINTTGTSTNITVTESTIKGIGDDGIVASGASSIITVTDTTITAADDGIVNTASNGTTNVSGTTITTNTATNGAALNIATAGGTATIENCTLTGRKYGVYLNSYSMTTNLQNNTIKSNEGVGVHDVYTSNSGRSNITINGGTIEGATHGVYTNYSNLTTSNVTIKSLGNSQDYYCIYTNEGAPTITINEGTKLLAPNASGIRNIAKTIYNAGEIKAERSNAYGIVNTSSGTLTVNGGTIYANKYGIYQSSTSANTYLGTSESELSTQSPLIEGGEYGFYIESGKAYFYSGRLKGKTNSYTGVFNKVRKAHQIYTFDEVIDENEPNVTRKVSYLTETEAFLQVGDDPENVFNTFEDALASITGTTDTITVLNDNMVYEEVVIPAGKDITLKLNDHTLTMTQTLVNRGSLSIEGGDDLSINKIINNTTDTIDNKGVLNIDKVFVESKSTTIKGTDGTNPITITDSKVRGKTAIEMDRAQPLTVTNSSIEGTNGHGIYQYSGSQKTVIINSTVIGSDAAVRQYGNSCITEITNSKITGTNRGVNQTGSDGTLTVNNSRITGNNYGIYSSGYRDVITLTNGTKIEGYDIGFYQDREASSDYSMITTDDTTIKGVNYGIYVRGAELNTTNTDISISAVNKDRYAAVCSSYSRCSFSDNTTLTADSASALYMNTNYTTNLTNTRIETNTVNALTINAYDGTLNINEGTEIVSNGYQSYGVYAADYDSIINVNGGSIYSKNIGVYLACTRSDAKRLNVNTGEIVGEVYAISQVCPNNTTTIGNLEDEVSITNPHVEGGLISINKTAGILNFYSGLLKGYVRGNPGTVDGVRTGYEIFDDEDEVQAYIRTQKTISTDDKSELPISNNSKEGNGYARLKYEEYEDAGDATEEETVEMIGYPTENTGSSGSGASQNIETIYNFGYTGTAQKFTAPRSGLYRIETWGAQGGYSLCNGSVCTQGALGGYSAGTIYLEIGTELYVYVGGRGANGVVGQNSEAGYNGGGQGSSDGSDDESSGAGGGATDIRLVNGNWDNQTSLASRIMVAAGGGGASWRYTPGYGGGLKGHSNYTDVSPKATQTDGYDFGIGQIGVGAADSDGVAGGGGGYYGGRSANVSYKSAGGGGSSYISGHTGSVAITSANDVSPRAGTNDAACTDGTTDHLCSIHYSNYTFENTTMIDGAGYDWTTQQNNYVGQTQPNGNVEVGHEGDGYARISFLGNYDQTFDYTGNEETFVAPATGFYKIEAWGASGGDYKATDQNGYSADQKGGYGGYSTGKVLLEKDEILYINVGGQGESINANSSNYHQNGALGGYNGGGTGGRGYSSGFPGGSGGGGATSIAKESGLLNTLENKQESIIIVSGGAGGAGWVSKGGSGGGYKGETLNINRRSIGGTQTNGYAFGEGSPGYAGYNVSGSAEGSSGSGGGFYGGKTYNESSTATEKSTGGAGGSGYIGNSLLSDKYMACYNCETSEESSTKTITTTEKSETPITDTAKIGNGYAIISYIGGSDIGSDTHTITLESEIGTIANPEIVINDGEELGTIPQPVTDNANVEFAGWYTNNTFTKKVTENTLVYMSTTLYAKFNYKETYCRTLEDSLVLNFDYTGSEQMYQVVCPGKYKVEVWGAQGGNATYNSYSTVGGSGGYSTGYTTFKQNEKLYINVGGQGNSVDYQQSAGTYTFDDNFGYNGGGYAILYTNNSAHAGGGGATHIATRRGTLASLKQYKSSVLIVAGGGGGAAVHKSYPSYSGDGGSGGGAVAGSGTSVNTTCYSYGTGGTQNTIGSYVKCDNDGRNERGATTHDADFGLGANFEANSTSAAAAGGGAGWYGGQAGYHAPGGGGSSYVSTRLLEDAAMYGYHVDEAYTDNTSNIAYLIERRELVVNQTTNEQYLNLQDAIDDAGENDILKYVANDYISYELEIPQGKHVIIDLNGYNIVESRPITNNGQITITNSSEEYTSKISNNSSVTQITNNGKLTLSNIKLETYSGVENTQNATLTLDNVEISASSTGISNAGKMTIEASNIYGATYDIYSNSDKTELISNTTLKSSSNAYYKYNNGDTTITDSTVRGPINNARSGQPLEVKDSVITSYIRNTGTTTYDNNEIKATIGNESNQLIYNTGILTLTRNDVEFKSTSTNSGSYDNTTIENHGTLTTTNNDYVLKHDYNGAGTYTNKYRYLYQIKNYGLLTSTNDEFTTMGGQYMYTIYNSSSNASVVESATITQIHGSTESKVLHNESGTITLRNSTADVSDINTMYGTYVTAGAVTVTNTNINIHDSNGNSSKNSYGMYIYSGSLTYDRGYTNLSNVKNGYGAYIRTGTFTFENGTLNLTGNTNSYGVYLEGSSATYTQGIYDGRGTDESDVSLSSPYISAVGSTTGLGVRQGGGTFNYYDGYITGSSSPRQTGDITSATELNYQVVTKHSDETGYDYCVLEFNR